MLFQPLPPIIEEIPTKNKTPSPENRRGRLSINVRAIT